MSIHHRRGNWKRHNRSLRSRIKKSIIILRNRTEIKFVLFMIVILVFWIAAVLAKMAV